MGLLDDIRYGGAKEQMAMLAQGNAIPGIYRPPTMREQLEARKAQAEEQLARVNAALAALDANPGFEGAFDAIQKVM